jgi:ATP-dependent RNA helicase DDX49/DBP8
MPPGKSQKQRLAALHAFKSEMVPLLLATDVASRGLDIPTVDLVVNYDLPRLAADYVHRWGALGLLTHSDTWLG